MCHPESPFVEGGEHDEKGGSCEPVGAPCPTAEASVCVCILQCRMSCVHDEAALLKQAQTVSVRHAKCLVSELNWPIMFVVH